MIKIVRDKVYVSGQKKFGKYQLSKKPGAKKKRQNFPRFFIYFSDLKVLRNEEKKVFYKF